MDINFIYTYILTTYWKHILIILIKFQEKKTLKYLKCIKISFKYFLQLRLLQSWWHSWYRLHYPRLFV